MPTALRLYPHQTDAVRWLQGRKRALLGDDMGLGKTPTALVAAEPPVVVVTPAVVAYNWAKECEVWRPRLSVQVVKSGKDKLEGADVTIVSYGLFQAKGIWEQLHARFGDLESRIETLIVDEAHNFRNRGAKRTRALMMRSAKPKPLLALARRVWALTGTPIANHPGDLWTWMKALAGADTPEDWREWRDRYCELTYDRYDDTGYKPTGRGLHVEELRGRLAKVMLRRRKNEVLDLPPVRIEQLALQPDTYPDGFKLFMRDLEKQLPAETIGALKDAESPADMLRDLLDHAHLMSYARLMGEAKAIALGDLLHQELEFGALDSVVVFCKHLDAIRRLAVRLDKYGVRVVTGAAPAAQRTKAVAEFQDPEGPRVFIGQMTAAGVGVTLTRSANVIFNELDWTPATNSQCADRVRRIGQDRSVRVRIVTLAGAVIDEIVTAGLARKLETIRAVVD